ncbi:MAG TPA: prepilin-type N-terminal cleavage/methylation domain-containing protein [Terriglobia bacterium]|nr:prepilin-type N-terminal cleavage/methylation domain-containing protein [Terriglobia bacterium]
MARSKHGEHGQTARGFTLLEMMASLAIISIIMGAVFQVMFQAQERFQGNGVITESNQAARSALQTMSQEISQAGFNPQYTSSKTSSSAVVPNSAAQCITLNSISGINPGDWVAVDTGSQLETVEVLATSSAALTGDAICGGANQIEAVFEQCHNSITSPCPATVSLGSFPVASYKFPFAGGLLQGQTVSYGGSNVTVSNDHILAMFYGDTDNSGNVWYVVYSLYNPSASGTLQSVTINGNSYNLYTLWRSITQVTFATGSTVTHAYPLVQNVLYQPLTNASPVGPGLNGAAGQPIFTYKFTDPVTIVPSTVSVVGTVVINLCVAVNPSSLETGGVVQWYTLATQIRPINLWSAVTTNQTGAGKYLPPTPLGLPMAFPGSLSAYYF